MTSVQQQYEQNFVQHTLVWLDENIDEDIVNRMKSLLHQIINVTYVKVFKDVDECVDYMSTKEKEYIYLLISGILIDTIGPLIYEIQQIKFIYIFHGNTQYSAGLNQTSHKVRGIFTDPITLCEVLGQDILANKAATSSMYDSSTLLLSALSSTGSGRSDQQEAEFMYFRLLAEILVKLKLKESTKNDFISICRSLYDGNTSVLKEIEEFNRTYDKEHAICWYTRNSFTSRILNEALRKQNIDVLFKLSFFIADLHNQLALLYAQQSKTLPSIVYRGQFMAEDEFEKKIKNNVGGLLSINSFFSTSKNREVALMFAGRCSSNKPNEKSVLFQITIEIEKCRRPVADIKHISNIPDEDEILFSMAPVFRIKSVEKSSSEDIWIVHLLMNGEEDEELNAVAESMKKELGQSNTLNTFGGLLMKMGDLQNAEYYFSMLIKNTQSDDSPMKVAYYSNLSSVYSEQMNYDAAISCAEKALQLRTMHPYMSAIIYSNLGSFYVNKGQSAPAFKYLHKAENIFKDFPPLTHQHAGTHYTHMGSAYEMEEKFPKALEYFLKATEFFERSLPANHPTLASIYSHIGNIYMKQDNYDSAVFYHVKNLGINQRSLPVNHANTVATYVNLGTAYHEQSNATEAHTLYQKTLEAISASPNQPIAPYVSYVLGQYHKKENRLSEALKFYHDSLGVQMKSPSPDYKFRLALYTVIAAVYDKQNNWKEVIEYYEKAIPIAIAHAPRCVPEIYSKIGITYGLIDEYDEAFRFSELALDSARNIVPPDNDYIQHLQKHRNLSRIIADLMRNKLK